MTLDPKTMTPTACFHELQPSLDEIARLVASAPLEKKQRAGLALLVAGHAFGVAAAQMDRHPVEDAREVADLIVDTLQIPKH